VIGRNGAPLNPRSGCRTLSYPPRPPCV
jgi:hypothetical protein